MDILSYFRNKILFSSEPHVVLRAASLSQKCSQFLVRPVCTLRKVRASTSSVVNTSTHHTCLPPTQFPPIPSPFSSFPSEKCLCYKMLLPPPAPLLFVCRFLLQASVWQRWCPWTRCWRPVTSQMQPLRHSLNKGLTRRRSTVLSVSVCEQLWK